MNWSIKIIATVVLTGLLPIKTSPHAWATGPELSVKEQGKMLVFSRQKGNCLSCHKINDGELYGNLGPPLVDLQTRFEDREALRTYIWDATLRKTETAMPPYGRHRILTDEEINTIVEYLWTL
jgi:sulfur-oxidizing protein SoxX